MRGDIMYYVISKSTDLRCPNTEIKKFSNLRSAERYASIGNGDFTYENPKEAKNYHHTFKHIYQLSGRINKKDMIFKESGSSYYPRGYVDNLAYYIEKYGEELK